jgi:pyruvate/2-oxoglutarate dehydrogenase complex dihydrolipoamide acyltransferase (E2) component
VAVVSEIFLERETANDEDGVVVAVHVGTGQAVKAGQPLFDVEHSKATMEICASIDGFLVHELTKGMSVIFGSRIACVVDAIDGSAPPSPTVTPQQAKTPPEAARASIGAGPEAALTRSGSGKQPQLSRAAAKLAEEFGLTGADFMVDLVSSADVRKRIDARRPSAQKPPIPGEAASPAAAALSNVLPGEKISPRKSEEIGLLQNGPANTTQSMLGVKIGKVRARREASDTFQDKILDLVVFEASRLMKQFPKLNSAFSQNQIFNYSSVNAGVAFDSGAKLVVYAIENANTKALREIREEIEDSLVRYLNDRLSLREMTRATFTVTDLSASKMDFILPILPDRQSYIIGVTCNASGEFSLYVGFDHRVTEGREVALFLDQLAERIASFDRQAMAERVRCFFCETPAGDSLNDDKRGLLKIVRAGGDEVLCCNTCWLGW